MANEITDPAADVAELVRHVLSPPSSGMGGGALSEERAQMLWRDRCVADLRSMRAAFGPRGLAPELHLILDVCAKILRVNVDPPHLKCDACGTQIDERPRRDVEVCGTTDEPGSRLCSWSRCMSELEDRSPDARREIYTRGRRKHS